MRRPVDPAAWMIGGARLVPQLWLGPASGVKAAEATSAAGAAELAVADRWFPSSKTHHGCGGYLADLKLGNRRWVCPMRERVDRDVNAACNILVAAGLAETQTVCGGSVSRGQSLAVPVKQEPADALPEEAEDARRWWPSCNRPLNVSLRFTPSARPGNRRAVQQLQRAGLGTAPAMVTSSG